MYILFYSFLLILFFKKNLKKYIYSSQYSQVLAVAGPKNYAESDETVKKCLEAWTFAGRLGEPSGFKAEERLVLLQDCYDDLKKYASELYKLDDGDRLKNLLQFWQNPMTDILQVRVLEAVKYMMFFYAMNIFKMDPDGRTVWQNGLFLERWTDPLSFVTALNCVGDDAGLTNPEMCLMGVALKTQINIYIMEEPDDHHVLVKFPEEASGDFEEIRIVSNDWRHYNTLTRLYEDF